MNDQLSEQLTRLDAALANTSRLVAGIGDDQWKSSTPCDKWNVRELVRHTVGVMANFAVGAASSGQVVDPDEFDLGSDPAGACRTAAAACVASWRARGELDSVIQLGDNELPGALAFNINMLDAYVHGWDIARSTGQDAELDPAICEELLTFVRPVVPETPREGDNFHAIVPVAAGASPADRLIGYLGRQP